jgi:hypothetical protein
MACDSAMEDKNYSNVVKSLPGGVKADVDIKRDIDDTSRNEYSSELAYQGKAINMSNNTYVRSGNGEETTIYSTTKIEGPSREIYNRNNVDLAERPGATASVVKIDGNPVFSVAPSLEVNAKFFNWFSASASINHDPVLNVFNYQGNVEYNKNSTKLFVSGSKTRLIDEANLRNRKNGWQFHFGISHTGN